MKSYQLFYRVLLLSLIFTSQLIAQTADRNHIEEVITKADIEFNIQFLAADEFLGRDTGTQELKIAARYIATWFERYGVEKAPGHDSYFQNIPFERLTAPTQATITIGDSVYTHRRNFLAMNRARGEITAPFVILPHATQEELEGHDVTGKIVISDAGLPGQSSPQQYFGSMQNKRAWAEEAGAVAVIELLPNLQIPWDFLVNFLGGDRLALDEGNDDDSGSIPHIWMNATQQNVKEVFESLAGSHADIQLLGEAAQKLFSYNVIGVIEGTDPELKEEYILLSAHYDHTGVVSGHPEPITSEYIFNGARDNAVGTVGVMSAAKYLAQNPPKRSVLLAAWTAEEIGLLGSRYFSDHPLVPLEQIVYNLNIDGAGYNDTTKVTVIGLGRTDADPEMIAAAEAFGLEAIPDPVPEQNLFDRSDNVNFARNGIPAPTYSMGLTAFDEEIGQYYHQTADTYDTINFNYVTGYIRSFIMAAQSIANRDTAPFWLPGDVYEEAGKRLYNKD